MSNNVEVKMRTIMASAEYQCDAGKCIKLPADLAEELVSAGCAEYTEAPIEVSAKKEKPAKGEKSEKGEKTGSGKEPE